jgi:hypothetical protein
VLPEEAMKALSLANSSAAATRLMGSASASSSMARSSRHCWRQAW